MSFILYAERRAAVKPPKMRVAPPPPSVTNTIAQPYYNSMGKVKIPAEELSVDVLPHVGCFFKSSVICSVEPADEDTAIHANHVDGTGSTHFAYPVIDAAFEATYLGNWQIGTTYLRGAIVSWLPLWIDGVSTATTYGPVCYQASSYDPINDTLSPPDNPDQWTVTRSGSLRVTITSPLAYDTWWTYRASSQPALAYPGLYFS